MIKEKERVWNDGFKDTFLRTPLRFIINIINHFCQSGFFTTFVCIAIIGLVIIPIDSLAVMQSENYKIKYETISGGEGPEQSSSYKLFESIGEVGEGEQKSTNYIVGAGQAFGIMANFPPTPTFVNDGVPPYHNRLHFTIDPGNNPSDTLFAIAITLQFILD